MYETRFFFSFQKLEFVVQGNGPSVLGLIASSFFSVYIECIFSMELYVLLKGYISNSIPECYILSFVILISQIGEDVGLEATAAKEYASINIIVCNGEIPGARFLPVSCAIGEACIPSGIISIIVIGGVLPVFTEYIELLNRNGQVYTVQFSAELVMTFTGIAIKFNIVSTQFCKAEIVSSFCKQCIVVLSAWFNNIIIACIHAAIANSCTKFSIIVSNLSSIIAISIAIEPAALITKCDRLTAKTNSYIFTKVMVYEQLLHVNALILGFILEIHVIGHFTVNIGRVINLTLYVNSHTAIPAVSFVNSLVLVTHTSVAGPVNVAHFLFQVGNANAQVSQFVSVFASQFVKGCTLFSVQLVFFCHEAGNDLSQFITGNVSFTFEGAIRITFYNALVGEVGYCLVSPVIGGNIGEWICCVSGYASGECCYSSDCENLFHSSSLL